MAAPHRWLPKVLCGREQRQKRKGRADLQQLCTTQTPQRNSGGKSPPPKVAKTHLTAVRQAPGAQLSTAPCALHLPGKKTVLYQTFSTAPSLQRTGEPPGASPPGVWQCHAAFGDQHPQGLPRLGALVRPAAVCASIPALAAAGLPACPGSNECSS